MFCGLGIWILDFEVRREAVAVRREGDVGVDVGGFVYFTQRGNKAKNRGLHDPMPL